MKRIAILSSLCFALLMIMSCAAPMAYKEEVKKVKKVAVISVGANSLIFHAETGTYNPPEKEDARVAERRKEAGFGTDSTPDCINQILAAAYDTVREEFKAIPHWQIIPVEAIKDNPAYKAAVGDMTNVQYYIPSATLPGTKFFDAFNADTETARPTWHRMADLARALDVDAVMVVYTSLAYKPTGMGFGLNFGFVKSMGQPVVGMSINVLTRETNTAIWARTGLKFNGDEVKMMLSGKVNFTKDEPAIMASYNKAVKASVKSIMGTVVEEMNAK